jgi:hypothetical protein
VKSTVALAPPRTNPAAFIGDLCQAIDRHAIDLVVPTCEEVFFLSRYRQALPSSCRIAVDDFDKLRALHSKWEFQALARECGGNPPLTATVSTIAEAREFAGSTPLVLKPEFSRFGVHVRIYPDGIPLDAPELPNLGRWVAQYYCNGIELCSYSIADRGRLLAHTVYQPKHRLGRSASYYFDHHVSAPIFKFVETLVSRIEFTGQVSFDWIEADNTSPSVIECNPRAISGLHLFSVDDALPAALTGAVTTCITPSTFHARMIAPVMLTVALGRAVGNGTLLQWWNDFRVAEDVLTTAGDHAPVLGALTDIGSYMRLALRQKCTLREAATHDIEWDGEDLVKV